MAVSFFSAVKQFLLFILHLFFTALFGWLTWAFWGLYEQQKLTSRFEQEGQPTVVTVADYSAEKKDWRDYLGNIKYIRFSYKGKEYTARYMQDSLYVEKGTKVMLLYHPLLNAFRQRSKETYDPKANTSKLIDWSSARLFSANNKALMACLLVSLAFFLLVGGLLARIPGLSFIRSITGGVFITALIIGAIYLAYDSVSYYQYYHRMKEEGEQREVTILGKERYHLLHNDDNGFPMPFDYINAAQINFNNEPKTIPISEDDYYNVSQGSKLTVLYNKKLNDMMAADYRLNPLPFIATGMVWLILMASIGKWISQRRK